MRTTTKEQVREAFNSLPPFPYISVIYGKGKNRTYKAFDLTKKREDTIGSLMVFLSEKSLTHNLSSIGYVRREDAIGRLIAFLSEKSLTHNLSSMGYVNGWGVSPERIEIRLVESSAATLNSNIDADMIQTILDCVNEIDERARNWG